MKIRSFFILEDKFFEDFPDPYLKGNKSENRPHYYCFKSENGLYWVIPTSTRYEKYQRIIDEKNKSGKSTDFLYITKLDNEKINAFLIGDMFPVTDEYVKREYIFNGSQLQITSEKIGSQIETQAKAVLSRIRLGYKFSPTQPDVLKIEKILLEKIAANKKSEETEGYKIEQIC